MVDLKNKVVNGNYVVEKILLELKIKVNGNLVVLFLVLFLNLFVVFLVEILSKQFKLLQVFFFFKDVVNELEVIIEYEKFVDVCKVFEKDFVYKEGEVQKLCDFNKDFMWELFECKSELVNQFKILLFVFEQ